MKGLPVCLLIFALLLPATGCAAGEPVEIELTVFAAASMTETPDMVRTARGAGERVVEALAHSGKTRGV